MQRRSLRRKKVQTPRHSVVLSKSRALICLDQEKIRKDYIRKCKRSIKDLEKVKKEILDYEQNDLPSYEKWYHSQFGKLMSEIREFHEKAKELFFKIREIEYYKHKKKITYYEAFLLVEDKLKNPEKYREEETEQSEFSDEDYEFRYEFEEDDEDSDFEKEYFDEDEFSDFEDTQHTNPELEREIQNAFAEFLRDNPEYAHLAKNPRIYKLLYENFRKKFYEDFHFNHKQKSEIQTDLELRIKAKYRELARKLHPDYRKESSPYLDELWYEVQKAYKDKDYNRLEMLLALSSIHQGDFHADFSISQILDVQREFKDQIKALRARLKEVKKHEAWGFSKLESTKPLEKKISKRLHENLEEEKQNYEYFKLILEKWSTPPRKTSSNNIERQNKTKEQEDRELFVGFLFD